MTLKNKVSIGGVPAGSSRGAVGLWIAALGIVFGDIGTSPLYTFNTVLGLTGNQAQAGTVLGALSLIVWTLIIVTSVKYVSFAMRIDNDGEGGVLALMSLLGLKKQNRPVIVALGLFGAALIYGDGTITPAISVLSALEGLRIAAPGLENYILPLACGILIVLFAVQRHGTSVIGRAFGPVMAAWFLVMALLGVLGIARNPTVLYAISPWYALSYLIHGGTTSFFVLGGVFLCVTGAEALYADMGHFGAGPIRMTWSAIVFPSLALNYAGQAAIVLSGGMTDGNIFYRLCPAPLLMPLIVLSTAATVIASQSIITGAFSMTRQAIHLGWMPRMRVIQTSEAGYGQIYIGAVNWTLMIATVALIIAFRKSDNLAAAYGIAVSATMLITTALLYIAMRDIWQWNSFASMSVAGAFFVVDGAFFLSNMTKIAQGGYVPLLLACAVYAVMLIWRRGSSAVLARVLERQMPIGEFMEGLAKANVPRVPGTAVFLTKSLDGAPPIVVFHTECSGSLHEKVIALTIKTRLVPFVGESEKVSFSEIAPNFWRVTAFYGFMETPDIQHLLAQMQSRGMDIDLLDVTYYVGFETIIPRTDGKGLPRWQEAIFATMQRNAAHATDFFHLPRERVVELGREIQI